MSADVRIEAAAVRAFAVALFIRSGLTPDDAATSADVLLRADLRGVMSHGFKNLGNYVRGLHRGEIPTQPDIRAITETPVTALIDGDGGLGMVVGTRAMQLAIEKARTSTLGMVTVRRSRHYGMASYYSLLALPHDMIGISLTNNSAVGVVPTFGNEPMLSTNPISVVIPAGTEPPFELDMSTAVVAMNKMDLARGKGEKVPLGWGVDKAGDPTDDPNTIWDSLRLLPLGSTREMGSHKGYGLGVVVDVLCGVLSGGIYGNLATRRPPEDDKLRTSSSHFFAAMRIDAFRPLDEFKADMDDMLSALKASEKAKGHDRVYVPGEIEHEMEQERLAEGIPYPVALVERLQTLAAEFDVPFEF